MANFNQSLKASSDACFPPDKGAVIVAVALLIAVLLGCAALAVDIGYLYVARAELQRTADAAAMAGAQALARDSDSPFGDYLYADDIYAQAESYALYNKVARQGVVLNRNTDITIGYLSDPHDLNAPLQIVSLDHCNAVQVIARRTTSSSGGEIPLFFAPIWGIRSSGVSASAIAVLDDRFYAFAPKKIGGVGAIPFSIDQAIWDDQIVNRNGPDEYSYDGTTENVSVSPDGEPEFKLFPKKLKEDEEDGAGNFGIIHIGPGEGALGTSVIVEQINNGISGDDLVAMTGEPMIKFYHQVSGEPVVYNAVTYDILGNPGLAVGLKDAMSAKIGKMVGFFIHSSISDTGANTVFNVVGMRFGRVMKVDIIGGGKAIVIQPAPYYGPNILTSPHVPSTDRLIGRLELVR